MGLGVVTNGVLGGVVVSVRKGLDKVAVVEVASTEVWVEVLISVMVVLMVLVGAEEVGEE